MLPLARRITACRTHVAASAGWPGAVRTGHSRPISPEQRKTRTGCNAGLALRRRFVFGPRFFKRHSHLFGAHESPADIPVFRAVIERNHPIAVRAVGLEPVADSL